MDRLGFWDKREDSLTKSANEPGFDPATRISTRFLLTEVHVPELEKHRKKPSKMAIGAEFRL